MLEAQRRPLTVGVGRHSNGHINGPNPLRSPIAVAEVSDFCYALGGKKPIHSILIANNGMAAVKFICSVRAWAYETFGTEKAILLVAMATPEDMRINAEHIRIADQFIEVPGGTNNNNYANVQLIVETAEITNVDAVWPGWGHASEIPELPDALTDKGIIFLGPPATSMAALGDKIGSSLIAQAAEVPTLPWSGSHVKIPPDSCLVSIPDDIYCKACVYTTEEAIASCQVVGYPAMIKASWGGGGKGIRKVHNDDEVRALFKQVQGEVPGSPIFIMKVASQSRHLEVQLLCDQYGNVAALHSRDCSVQRRHQKIIEEGPITVAPLETVKKLEQAARRLAKCVNYVGAATVEYLYSMDTGEYYFLELNPRLQVEHPVTEWIAEVNLPAAQVAVGMGIPLWQIPEIRRFYGMEHSGGYDAWRRTSVGATSFDFDKAESTRPKGHCVAVRVTSEDPDDGFKPTSGKVQELNFKSKPNVWAYFSVKSGGGIHEFSDSQFGHVFAFGESRALAIANMVLGLKEIQIRGEIRTNVDYTIDLLHASDYKDNKIHTGWLDSRIAMRVRAERPPWYLSVVGGALYKASASSVAMVSEYVGYLEKGQIPPKHISLVNSHISLNIEGSKYTIDMVRGGPGSYRLRMNESEVEVEIHTLRDGGLLMQLDGNSHVIYAEEEAAGTRLLIDGRTCLLQNDHDPSKLVAETPCKLLRYLVSDGSHVDADTPYAEVEVMKMCMPLLSPASGIIQFKMSEGQAMQAGELIARLDLDDPSAVRKAEPFHGSFPILGPPTAISGKVHQRCAASLNAARMILAGYDHNIDEVVQNLLNCLDNPELPFLQWQECLSVLATRLPKDLRFELESKFKGYKGISSLQSLDFPAKVLRGVLEAHLSSCPDKEKGAQERLVEPLLSLVKSYEGGRESHARVIVQALFEEYLSVEELFSDNIQADVIEHLRLQYKKDLLKIVDIVLSHQGVKGKNKLILRLMDKLVYPNPAAYREKLIRFYALNHTIYSELALKASQLLEQTKLSELRSSIARSLSELEMFTEDGESMDTPKRKIAMNERMEDLVSTPLAVEDALVGLFDHSDHTLQRRVVETYVRRLYQPYLVKGSVRMQWHRYGLIASWEFLEEHIERNNASEDHMLDKPLVEKHTERKWGAMVIIKSLQFLPMVINAALRETTHNTHGTIPDGSIETASHGNMMHIALVGINNQMSLLQDSGDEDQAQERIYKLAKILKEKEVGSCLHTAGVGVISCIIQRDEGRTPMRHSFHWSTEKLHYDEEPLFRHLEPPLSIYLELDKLKGYENIKYTPSRDRQWHLYTVVDKPLPIQRMFLRTLVRQPTSNEGFMGLDTVTIRSQLAMSFTSRSILRSLMTALEELELHVHSATIKSDLAHMYLYILREQQIDDLVPFSKKVEIDAGQEEAAVEMILEEMVRGIHEFIGVKMHRLGVCEWEVKLWMTSAGQANGTWRVVVENVTGHTCTVHIVGKEDGLGVENLSGSGAIASAYSRAYKETFTLTYVTGRTVGIGAYLARLGMRCIQRLDQPIILTGFSALNKLLGREVYSSHMQLGGPKIMATNGVVHLTVSDDLEGVSAILKWLSFVPPYSGGPLPILTPSDPPERTVEYLPENSCDPRGAICGVVDGGGKWLGGMFDKDSFVETLEGWARTVVTGRAKLGGIPVGIVAVETQTVMQVIPADPGQLDSHERVVPQAGQVWFPDSATKTAQALMDFNREELPLFILANWRGFSGGQRDLFEGILQAGSTIVENLRTYKQPVFVYIPMMGELRGGAWVVVDSRINSDHIEMYAERTAKGNVLEPEGMIEIKFRTKELLECMGRLDQKLIDLKAKLQEAKSAGTHTTFESLQQQIKAREKQLLPVYTQIATKFAELHDTSLRMAAKGVIREVVDWSNCRSFFYKRLHRRVVEASLIKTVRDAAGDQLSHKSAMDLMKKWFSDSKIAEGRDDAWEEDEVFFTWKDDPTNYEENLQELRAQKVLLQLSKIGDSQLDLQALPQGLAALLHKVEPSSRAQLVDELRKVLD
ncbi:Biotin carboxylase [Actinidia chinensis var. chinensis]|uniref:Biotin carboxylase n=1 Tax=Actinidia chinensis var. chinensis TaxID=1590841 RepID=A0A2R6QYI8_ACTCC|nr:Biotin carboxylase [Actinidia chinensis var. chinensis]